MFQALDGGEELEDHHKDEEKAGENNGIDIILNTDEFGDRIADTGESDDDSHPAPDDDADEELDDSLSALAFEVVGDALIEHKGGHGEDDDLIEGEGHKGEFIKLKSRKFTL